MHKSNEDCFYFLTSSCAKGPGCTYRHSPLAITCNVICPAWLRGNCPAPACPFRHSTIQRPMMNSGILCFYENTPTGCLKPECTFIHSKPRLNSRNAPVIRPALTNPITNDTTKAIVNNTPLTTTAQTSETNLIAQQPIKNDTTAITPVVPSLNAETTSLIVKPETITRRIAIPPNSESSNEKMHSSDNHKNNSSSVKCTTRSIITDSAKATSEETTQSRLVINRNVVISESTNAPNRTIAQTASSSNRVVVSSNSIDSSSKGRKNDADAIAKNDGAKKFKSDSQSTIDIPFPCSTSSIANRLLLISSKETTSTNDTKPIRLSRHRLPATNTASGNSSSPVSSPSNEEKTSTGTGLSQENERRTMRLERFQKNPISPTQSITGSSSTATSIATIPGNSSTTRQVVTSSRNERKRTAPETTRKDLPPSKRLSVPSSPHQPTLRKTTSSPDVVANASASTRNKNGSKQTDEFIAQSTQQRNLSPTKSASPQSASSSPVRPRFTPQLITPPSSQATSSTAAKAPRLRQPPSVVIKRLSVPVTASSPTSTKTIEQVSSHTSASSIRPPSLKSTVERPSSIVPNEEDENELLNESADVVDTFALIDEALLEADHLLELM